MLLCAYSARLWKWGTTVAVYGPLNFCSQPQISAGKSQNSPNSCSFPALLLHINPLLPPAKTPMECNHLLPCPPPCVISWIHNSQVSDPFFFAPKHNSNIQVRQQELGGGLPMCHSRSTHAGKCPGPGAAGMCLYPDPGRLSWAVLGPECLKQKGSLQNTRKCLLL